jgi:hypothetical protein
MCFSKPFDSFCLFEIFSAEIAMQKNLAKFRQNFVMFLESSLLLYVLRIEKEALRR